MESVYHERLNFEGQSEPLFPQKLKVEYVRSRFDKLVSNRAVKLEKIAARRTSNSTADDWSTNKGDDSDDDVSMYSDDDEAAKISSNDALLDAYLAQVRSFAEAQSDQQEDVSVFVKEGCKKRSGQLDEEKDDEIMERAANGTKKMTKLPKLPSQTHVERCQSQALDHASRMSSSFEQLALLHKPDSVETFSAKITAGVEAASSVIAGAFRAWSDSQAHVAKASRSCVNDAGHDFVPVPGTSPAIVVCKACGMRV